MVEKVENYFLVVLEVRGFLENFGGRFEKLILLQNYSSSRKRKVVIEEGDKWFKYLDEEENLEKHGS
ncbi:hypothetical protein Tco_1501773 [Tanacetum coccineum]